MKENLYYELQGHTPVVTTPDRGWKVEHVGDDTIDRIRISTVFLGYDHNWSDKGSPILFETMIFTNGELPSKELEHYLERYHTWDEAERAHHRTINLVRYFMLPWYKKIFKKKP